MLRLRTLGGLTLESDPPVIRAELSSRRLALLAVIGANSQGVSRESLLALFWPESTEERARNALNQALFVLRRELPPGALVGGTLNLRLDPAVIVCDAAALRQAVREGRDEDAAGLWGGAFLEGVHIRDAAAFNTWRDAESAQLTREYGAALERLAAVAEGRGDLPAAVGWWQRRAALDPTSTRIALRLMLTYAAGGDTAAALRHARNHELLVGEELGAACDPAVLELAERLRAEAAAPRQPAASVGEWPTGTAAGPPAAGPAPEDPLPIPPRTPDPPVEPVATTSSRRRRRLRQRLVQVFAAAAVLLLLVAVVRSSRSGAQRASVVIQPFEAVHTGRDSVPGYLREGVVSGLIDALARVEGLQVIIGTDPMGNAAITHPAVAAGLDVDVILTGTIQPIGGEFRIRARLVRAESGIVLWSGTMQTDGGSPLAAELEIARAVASSLGHTGALEAPPGATANPRAHAAYTQGFYLLNLRRPDDVLRAIDWFERAIDIDSSYGMPHAMLAQAYLHLGNAGQMPLSDAFERARRAAARALALDSRIAAAHTALAGVHSARREWREAEAAYRHALRLEPYDALTRSWYGFVLLYSGRERDGLRQLEYAVELDPLSLGIRANLAWGYYFTRQHARALETFASALEFDSISFALHNGVGRALQQLGRYPEAIAAYRRAVELGGTPQGKAFLAQALARTGERDEADALRREIADHRNPIVGAIADVGFGDYDSALSALERAARTDVVAALSQVPLDPIFDPLRGNARFERIVDSIVRISQR